MQMILQYNSKPTDKNTWFFHGISAFRVTLLTAFMKYHLSKIQAHMSAYTSEVLDKQ